MKKGFFILIIVLAIASISTFIFIPSSITVAGYKTINCPAASVSRLFGRNDMIRKWWPGEIKNDTTLSFQNINYAILKNNLLGITLSAETGDVKIAGDINSIPLKNNTSAIQLQYQSFKAGFNPVKRIAYYFKALTLKKQLDIILNSFKEFASDEKNIYGLSIVETKVKDSSLVSTKKYFDHYPTNKEVDDLINKLKQHIAANGGVIRDYPMLNIHINEDKKYEAMVAIPLLKDIPVKGDIIIKKMILGNILEAKLTGGDFSINNGMNALKNYAKDYEKVSPAIPFQLMVTDRNRETDTTKWVTVLRYPVFY